jgi:hypothetical protein
MRPRKPIEATAESIISANSKLYKKRLYSVNQGSRGDCFMKKKNEGRKDFLFKHFDFLGLILEIKYAKSYLYKRKI